LLVRVNSKEIRKRKLPSGIPGKGKWDWKENIAKKRKARGDAGKLFCRGEAGEEIGKGRGSPRWDLIGGKGFKGGKLGS